MADWDGGESRGEWKRRRHQAPGELDDNTLHSISAQIHAGEWRGLATRLGFSPAEISDFTSHYAYTTDQIYHMLVSWRTKHSDDASQREALSKALWEVGNTYLADELSEHSTSDEQSQDVSDLCEKEMKTHYSKRDLSRHNLGDTAASWCQHVKQCKTLQELRLRECSLTGQDMVHVAGSLRDLPNLVGLYLTNNNLGGTAAVWCEQLKKCKALRTLNLHCCELSQKEKILIKKSLRDLKKKGLLIL
ncbi:uncharacterized protein LOC110975361 isoform X2 [Acanthaster planci]|uniref:Uncharacterized protein LOC110975361 isoform X2 n=1 Tax=Acanthaster planci TaxID=133434 RepID=A0A8B7XU14_ACAPL|nr:uncharacterized protein LOC110975361 isoform X2 [Acanthaster planci]